MSGLNLFGLGPSVSLFSFNPTFGISFGGKSKEKGIELNVPWDSDNNNTDIFSLMHWKRKLSIFRGRDEEMKILDDWANDGRKVSIKFIIGDGGSGKTRLAAEFAQYMIEAKGWSAGFVNLNVERNYSTKNNGVLLLIDYPEQYPDAVRHLLHTLDSYTQNRKLRILFITRSGINSWSDMIIDSGVQNMLSETQLPLDRLNPDAALEVYKSTTENVLKIFGEDQGIEISEDLIRKWLDAAPLNNRALYIVGAALKYALDPKIHDVTFSVAEIIDSLVERELTRLRISARHFRDTHDVSDEWAFAKLLAMATFAGEISIETVIDWANREEMELGFDEVKKIRPLLKKAHLTEENVIRAHKVFNESDHIAPEMLWNALELNLEDNLKRFERIDYDVSRLIYEAGNKASNLIKGEKHFPNWLKSAVEKDKARCLILEVPLYQVLIPQSLLPTAISVYEKLLEGEKEKTKHFSLLSALSNFYSYDGNNPEALKTISKAVIIERLLVKENPAEFESNLATGLNNMSVFLSFKGDNTGALKAISEAVEIRRRLATDNSTRFEPDLAMSLNNMSNWLSNVGDNAGALEAIREAVKIRRRLASDNPVRFEPDLASSLNNISNELHTTGDNAGALKAIWEAVEIFRRLAERNPARYESSLAQCLNSMSSVLSYRGDNAGALEAIKEAVDVYRRLSEENPARFEFDLAMSLNNMSNRLSCFANNEGTLKPMREAVDIYRRLASDNPARFDPNLATCLNNMSNWLSNVGDKAGALEAIMEAVKIRRRLVLDNPVRFKPDLAQSLGVWGDLLLKEEKIEVAIQKITEAIELAKPYAEEYPKHQADRVYQWAKGRLSEAESRLSGESV
jgi:tetratricopeptide (TPR) repeat protein